ncbi:MAG: response regulator [Deltaproteobacteria bacterium]|jgi:putative two-component system response regulator|nr:response regulator [Deltaproteobacteria bacterium]
MFSRLSRSPENSVIFIVDDNLSNLDATKASLPKSYEVFSLQSAEKLFKILARKTPDLILLDVEMPVMNGFETIKILKSEKKTSSIPVIFLSSLTDTESLRQGLELGAADFLTKPVLPKLLQKSVELHLSVIAQQNLLESQRRALDGNDAELSSLRKGYDTLVGGHDGKHNPLAS